MVCQTGTARRPLEPPRVEFALKLGQVLADLGLPVPRPLSTLAGTRWCRLDGLSMAVFEFVVGEPLSDEDLQTPRVAGQAARLVAAIHSHTTALAAQIRFVERYDVLGDGLYRCLTELAPGTGGADALVEEARELVWPQRDALLGRLARVRTLGDAARSLPPDRVLCHGDLIGDNVLRDRSDELWVVDWDAAALGPRERDLAMFTGRAFEPFVDGYERAADDIDLDLNPGLIEFFLLRRNLDDLVDWLLAVLTSDRAETQRRADLDGVGWCLSRWIALEERIEHARSVLARRQRGKDGR